MSIAELMQKYKNAGTTVEYCNFAIYNIVTVIDYNDEIVWPINKFLQTIIVKL